MRLSCAHQKKDRVHRATGVVRNPENNTRPHRALKHKVEKGRQEVREEREKKRGIRGKEEKGEKGGYHFRVKLGLTAKKDLHVG